MNSDIVQKELKLIESDKQFINIAIEAEKEAFAQQLRKGLGDDIKQSANNVNVPIVMKVPFKIKAKRAIRRLLSIFHSNNEESEA